MATRALQVTITGDPSSFNRALKRVDSDVDRSEKRLSKFGKVGAAALGGIGLAAGAAAAVGLKKAAEAAIEAEKSQARMATQLKATGISYRQHTQEIDRVIQKHSQLSGLDDEDLQDSFTNIIRVTGKVDKSLRLTGLAADFARAKHMDVAKAGELVAKVAGGNTGILGRYGIKIKEGASATEALGTLQEKFAGQARAYGRTTAGSVDRASVAWENLLELLGAKIAPLIVKVTDFFTILFSRTSKGNKVIRDVGEGYVKYLSWIRDALQNAIRFVQRWADRNREELNDVVRAMRNVARAARAVFEDVVIPILKRVAPIARDLAQGVLRHIGGMVRLITALINGDWHKAWKAFNDTLTNARQTAGRVMGRIGAILVEGLKKLGPMIGRAAVAVGRELAKGVAEGIKSTITGKGGGIIADALRLATPGGLGSVIGKAVGKDVGDGIGRTIGPSLSVGGLDGADPDLAPFAAVGARYGLRVSDGMRPGGITSSGNVSFHASGDAIDLAGPAGGMLATFRTLKKNFGGRLRELIYTPGGAGIKDGRPFTYTGQVAADHHDHVHVAYTGPFGDGLGKFETTAYGPPWNAMNGTGVTATGVDLRPAKQAYGVAVDPSVIPLGSKLKISPNPFNYSGLFEAFDTGGAIKGKRIDFYDWRGRKRQLGWGRRSVTVSTESGGGGGALGAGAGGGGGAANKSGSRGAFREAQRGARREAGEAVQGAQERALEPGAGYELGVARAGRNRARAEGRDDLSGVIKAMVDERAIKRRRLKRIRKLLKGRLGKKRRTVLVNEEAQLTSEIGDLTESIREYKADQKGGATTISEADELDAGVDTNAPTASDFADAALAQAELTPGTEDDLAALRGIEGIAGTEYNAALASGDPRRIAEAARNLKSARDAIEALTGTIAQANEFAQQRLALDQEMVANQRKILALSQQGPAILAAIVAAVNGSIGGTVGLGFSATGYAGATARY